MAYKRRNREFEEKIAGLVRQNGNPTALPPCTTFSIVVPSTLWFIVGLGIGYLLRGF
jgi:hypothetical protein